MQNRNSFILLLLFIPILALGQNDKLSGTIISSLPIDANSMPENAFDGNTNTSFVASEASMAFVGLDLGKSHVITSVSICASHKAQSDSTLLLGLFEGANRPDFMDALPLRCITDLVDKGCTATFPVEVTRGFRYVRYVGPANRHCAVSKVAFMGYESEGFDSIYYQVTNLPTFSIHTTNCEMPLKKKVDIESSMTLIYENGTQVQEYPILVRPRGNFSFTMENKPYRFKFNDDKKHHIMTDSETDKSPAKKKKWCLINNSADKTLMRTLIASEVSRKVGMSYVPYARSCDVFLNGEYRGNYLIMDYLDVNKNRIDIDEMEATDVEGEELTGGYFLEYDGWLSKSQGEIYFYSHGQNGFTVRSPEDDVVQIQQLQYIKSHINKFENKLFAENYQDTIEGYRSMFDLESFLKYFLTSEFNGNHDMFWQWFFIKKRGDEHIYIGPIWDAEFSMNNSSKFKSYGTQNDYPDWTYTVFDVFQSRKLVERLLSDPRAFKDLQDLWQRVREEGFFTSDSINAYLDHLTEHLKISQRLHYLRWPYMDKKFDNVGTRRESWEAEIENVRSYLLGRIEWMDRKLSYNSLEQKDGVYKISNPKDLITFANIVDAGEVDAKVELCENLDMSLYNCQFNPIGTVDNPYKGYFDGKGFTISNLKVKGKNNVGLFGHVAANAKIKNVVIDASCEFEGEENVGAIAGRVSGTNVTIDACGSFANIVASQSYAGGLVGKVDVDASVNVTNSFYVGHVNSIRFAGDIMGNATPGSSVTNCYFIGDVEATADYTILATACTETDAHSGKACFDLNQTDEVNLWFQNIDNGIQTDAYPLPFNTHAVVYKKGNIYTNINPNGGNYRYYQLRINKTCGSESVQFAEFDLLDEELSEIPSISVYAGSKAANSKESWENLCDDVMSTKYYAKLNPFVYVLFDAGSEIDVHGYRFYPASDARLYETRNPSEWVLYGSNVYTKDANADCWNIVDKHLADNSFQSTYKVPNDYYIPHSMQEIRLAQTEIEMQADEEYQLNVVITPLSMSLTKLLYTSANESVVKITDDGVLHPTGDGETTIEVSAPFLGNAKTKATVRVSGSDEPGYRYYLLKIDDINFGIWTSRYIQISEFELLDKLTNKVEGLNSYAGEYAGTYGYNVNENYDKMTDGNMQTKMCLPFGGNASFFFDAERRIVPSAYVIGTCNDTQTMVRSPKSWNLWGSNSKSDCYSDDCWVLLDNHIEDSAFLPSTNYKMYTFQIGVEDGVDIIRNNGNGITGLYDLTGRKWSKTEGGLYIQKSQNGVRKIIKQ